MPTLVSGWRVSSSIQWLTTTLQLIYHMAFYAAGVFEAILGEEDAVISDELNHASIIDGECVSCVGFCCCPAVCGQLSLYSFAGIRLCKAQRRRYKHLDLGDLEKQLVESQSARVRLIVTDGVFSMDGDVAPLKDICALAERYNAQVFIDECHATGFFGATGRGTDEYCGVRGRIDVRQRCGSVRASLGHLRVLPILPLQIINSTLGKAMGGATGGYTAGGVCATMGLLDFDVFNVRYRRLRLGALPQVPSPSLTCFVRNLDRICSPMP